MESEEKIYYKIHFKNSNKEVLISEKNALFIEKGFINNVKMAGLYEGKRLTEIINLDEILFIELC